MTKQSFWLALVLSIAACSDDKTDNAGEGEGEGEGEGDATVDGDGDGFNSDEDCDDADSAVNPAATELCNDIDDDCDDEVDEGVKTTFYADADEDSYGARAYSIEACSAPDGYVTDDTDCDDSTATVYPGAAEICNEMDDDCDIFVDEDVTTTFYADTDGDTFGDPTASVAACSVPSGYSVDGTDCDDTDIEVNPAATEICSGMDDDCDASTSEDGMVSFTDTAGTTTDVSTSFTGAVSITTDGSYLLCDGSYVVNLDIDADVDLTGVNGAGSTTLDGDAIGPVVAVADGKDVNLSALTITNGTLDDSTGFAGGVHVGIGATVAISDAILSDNVGYNGGAISVYEGAVNVSASTFENNGAEYGGDFWVLNGEGVFTDCSSTDAYAATAAYGYVLGYGDSASIEIDDSTFDGGFSNQVGLYAASAFGEPVELTISSSAVTRLSSTDGGALTVYGNTTATSFDTDWGTSAGRDDNLPVDVYTISSGSAQSKEYSYEDDEFFTCTGEGCETYVAYAGVNATLYHAWSAGGTSSPGVFTCELDFTFEGTPTTDLCEACDYGFEGTWVFDTSTANTTSCFYFTEDIEMDVAFAGNPTFYDYPMIYLRFYEYTDWSAILSATRTDDTVVGTYGFYNYALMYYGTYYYYTEYLKIELEVY